VCLLVTARGRCCARKGRAAPNSFWARTGVLPARFISSAHQP